MSELKKFRTAHKHLIGELSYDLDMFKRFIKIDVEHGVSDEISDAEIEDWYFELKSEIKKDKEIEHEIDMKMI